jgi:hypothetical protein
MVTRSRDNRWSGIKYRQGQKYLLPSQSPDRFWGPGPLQLIRWVTGPLQTTNYVALVRKRTIPTERPPLVGEDSAKVGTGTFTPWNLPLTSVLSRDYKCVKLHCHSQNYALLTSHCHKLQNHSCMYNDVAVFWMFVSVSGRSCLVSEVNYISGF